jgi:hypothetical protein
MLLLQKPPAICNLCCRTGRCKGCYLLAAAHVSNRLWDTV